MSFRGRLLVFFTIIVVIPMIAVALVLFSLTEDSEHGKVDARLASGMRTALSLYEEGREAARRPLGRVASDRALTAALPSGDAKAIRARLRELAVADPRIESIAYYSQGERLVATAGSTPPVAAARVAPTTAAGRRLGTLAVSVTSADELAQQTARFADLDVRVLRGGRILATTIDGTRGVDAESGDVTVSGEDYRARVQDVGEAIGPTTLIHVLQDASDMSSAISRSRMLIGGLLGAFLVLSLVSSVFVVRALQGQVDNFLQAARRLGGGDLGERVPVEGDDEFAALGQEFNTMAEQLQTHIAEVERKRRELEDSIRRIGEAFGTGLDRQGLVDLAVRTAIEACGADAGRMVPVDPREIEEVRIVDDPLLQRALEAAERRVFAAGAITEPSHDALEGVHSLAMPLLRHDEEGEGETLGVISIARRGSGFTLEQCDLLAYLTTQTAVSLENADLHRRIQRQAITDELTGLSNVRHFHELLDQEIERAQRFNNHIGLVMVDIDNFKSVNDTYGHPQGDLVLKEVARVLREQSRDIDYPARYGGEEMSVILPQTDIEGAAQLAERMREAIEELTVRRLDGDGVLKLTASFGVASMPGSATDKRYLIAVADEALYRAKHGGKNRVERATPTPEASPGSR